MSERGVSAKRSTDTKPPVTTIVTMSHEKSKKSVKNPEPEALNSLKDEVRRGLNLLDQCVNNIAQAKWILISVEASIDQFQTGCSSCNEKVRVVKKEPSLPNVEGSSLINAKVHTLPVKPQPTPKDTNASDSEKKKIAQVEPRQIPRIAIKDKTEDLNEQKPTNTAKRTGGAPGRSFQATSKPLQAERSLSQPKLNSKNLSQLESVLKKAKLTQVSLQCVAAIMRGSKSININEILKRDPKFKLNCELKERKKKLSSVQSEGSSYKHTSNPPAKEKPLKTSSLGREREIEMMRKESEKERKKQEPTKIRKESRIEMKNSTESYNSRKDSVHSTSSSSKLKKRRHSSSSSSSSRSCSTCSSATIVTNKSKDPAGSDTRQVPKKPKALISSDDEGNHKSQHKIKVSKDSSIKSKAALKYHDDSKKTDKAKSKRNLDHNGNASEKSEYKSKEKTSSIASDRIVKSNKPEENYNQKLEVKKTEHIEKSKGKSDDQTTNVRTGHDTSFDKLKSNLEPKENSKKESTPQPSKNSNIKESNPEPSEFPKKKDLNSEPPESRQKNEIQGNTSHTPQTMASKQSEAISENSTAATADTPETPEMEDKFQRFLRQLKARAEGKTELKEITTPHALFTEARQKGITSLDSPAFKQLILEMFRQHQALKEAAARKAAEQAGKKNTDHAGSTSQKISENSTEKKVNSTFTNHAKPGDTAQESPKVETVPLQSKNDDAIPDEDTELYNEARRLGIKSKNSDEYRKVVDHINYMKFKQSKGELLMSLKSKTQKMFQGGASQKEQNSDDPAAKLVDDETGPADEESMELEEDIIGNCLDVITSTSGLQSETEEPSSTVAVAEGDNADRTSIASGKDSRKLPELVPTPILTLQDTVSPTAMKKFFGNDVVGE